MNPYQLVTLAERPELEDPADGVIGDVWPEFMLNDQVANRFWMAMIRELAEFQFVLLDGERIAAVGNSIPLAWEGDLEDLPDTGWDWALRTGVEDRRAGRAPTLLSAISASVALDYQGQGLSRQVVLGMNHLVERHGLQGLAAPVRPVLKSAYPLTPMETYVAWQTESGEAFDPWLRVHRRLGASFVKVAHRSMCITGPVERWEEWTGMRFPDSGSYIIPHALTPVEIDRQTGQGLYIEPNVWMWHET